MRGKLLAVTAICWALAQLLTVYFVNLEAIQLVAVHLAFALSVSFLVKPLKVQNISDNVKLGIDVVSILFVILSCLYFILNYDRIRSHMPGVSDFSTLDAIAGAITIIFTIEATRRVLGLPLTIMGIVSLLYLLFGSHLVGLFKTREISLAHIIEYNYFTSKGLLGIALQVSATYVYVFVLFSSIMDVTGLGPKFLNIVMSIAGNRRGGPAKVAIISSALFGMLSGSPSSNVAFTGSLTIPLMKKTGFRPSFAAAVESVASSGAMVIPPLLGTAIFLMMQFTQASMMTIVVASIIPAILYFLALFIQVDLESMKQNIKALPKEELMSFKQALKEGWYLFVPIAVIMVMLIAGYSPQLSAIVSIIITLPLSYIRKESRLTLKKICEACIQTGTIMTVVATATATAGIILFAISFAGLEFKTAQFLLSFAGDHLTLLIFLIGFLTYILGMGLPVLPAYIIVSIITAPILVTAGMDVVTAHLFVFYFAMMSLYTPPVAPCAFIAAGIAGAGPFQVAWDSMKLGIGAVSVPLIIALHPSLVNWTPVSNLVPSLIFIMIGIYALCCAFSRYMFTPLSYLGTSLLCISAILLFVPFMTVKFVGLAIFVVYFCIHYRRKDAVAVKETDKLVINR